MLNSALPDDWPALEGALQAASVLASALPQVCLCCQMKWPTPPNSIMWQMPCAAVGEIR